MKWIDGQIERELRREYPLPLTPQEWGEVGREASRRTMRSLWLGLASTVILAGVGAGVVKYSALQGGHSKLAEFVMAFVAFGALNCIILLIVRCRSRLPLRRALRDRGFEICLHCGYWLRGLGSDVKHCPECGEPRQAMNAPVLEQTE